MAPTIKLVTRKLNRDESEIISEEITRTPNITGYQPKELMAMHNILVLEDDAELIGILAYVKAMKFIDLKILIVREKFRDRGYGKKLFNNFAEQVRGSKKPVYVVTKNPAVIHLLEEAGYRRTGLLRLPLVAILHQLKMAVSIYRAKEYIRKTFIFRGSPKFSYWIKYQ